MMTAVIHVSHGARSGWLRSDGGPGRFFGQAKCASRSLPAGRRADARLRVDEAIEERSGGSIGRRGYDLSDAATTRGRRQIVSESLSGKRVYKLTEAGRASLRSATNRPTDLAAGAAVEDWAAPWIPDSAEIRAGGTTGQGCIPCGRGRAGESQRIERVREILLRALRDLEELGEGVSSH